jgi:hypothetical protein
MNLKASHDHASSFGWGHHQGRKILMSITRAILRRAIAGSIFAATAVIAMPAANASEYRITARTVGCGSLEGDALRAAWHGVNSIGGLCVVDGGTIEFQFGRSNINTICAGDHHSLIRYNLPNDPVLYSSTTERRTCMPFDQDNTIKSITRTR